MLAPIETVGRIPADQVRNAGHEKEEQMTEEPARFDPGPAFRDDVRRARARVAAMTPEAAKAVLLELVATMAGLRARLVDSRRWPSTLDSTAGVQRRAHIPELNCRQSNSERPRSGVDRPAASLTVLPQRAACRSTHRRA
jgi:hypothetical protein